MTIKTCPDCGGKLEQGTILDYTHGAVLGERYAKIDKMPQGKNVFMWLTEGDYRDIRRVVTYRCLDCNRLFPYAQDEVIGTQAVSNGAKGMFAFVMIVTLVVVAVIGLLVFIDGSV